jgi:hypothetical protein
MLSQQKTYHLPRKQLWSKVHRHVLLAGEDNDSAVR